MHRSVVVLWLAALALPACKAQKTGATETTTAVVKAASAPPDAGAGGKRTGEHLASFASDADLRDFLAKAKQRQLERQKKAELRARASAAGQPGAAAALAPAAPAASAAAPSAEAKADGLASSITNNQHANVDEGDIVKLHGRHLVVLRRGRIFAVDVGSGELSPSGYTDAFGPGIDPNGTWYDEMLVSKDTVAVIGYSYARGGTEVGLFRIDDAGSISPRGTYHLRSNDYYSARNYASRLVGDKLVFYAPLYVSYDRDAATWMPAVRKWKPGVKESDWVSVIGASRIAKPLTDEEYLALHSVTTCDLGSPDFTCTARAVLAPPGRVFYVSPSAVYVWTTEAHWWGEPESAAAKDAPKKAASILYRMPLDGGEPSAMRVRGAPVDQLSFDEGADGMLNVLVTARSQGDAMWASDASHETVAALRVPVARFGHEVTEAEDSEYTALGTPEGYGIQNRFVSGNLLFGTSYPRWRESGKEPARDENVYVHRLGSKAKPAALPLGHAVERIEVLGKDAVVVGQRAKDLVFSAVALSGDEPAKASEYLETSAAQGESRSHGFFYRPTGEGTGVLGLPLRSADAAPWSNLRQGSASILFLRNESLRFSPAGKLRSADRSAPDDGCRASCVDWYGNARPIFLGDRVLALMGYELVEGRLDGGTIRETRRVSFAPRSRK